jgi:Ca-activated chloride channel family protein
MRRVPWVCLIFLPLFAFSENLIQPDSSRESENPERAFQRIPGVPTVRVRSNLVLVPLSVRDSSGKPVTNLRMEDFYVSENGVPVSPEHFGKPELTRLDIVLVFDLTSSLWSYFDLVKDAASGFVRSIFRREDTVSVIGLSSEPTILLERNGSLPVIVESLDKLRRFGAATAFFDAVIAATRIFPDRSDPETRHVVVVLSDGEDNLSSRTLADTLQKLQKTDSIFYSINPGASQDRLNRVSFRGQQCMEELAEQTGGEAFMVDDYRDLGTIYRQIAEDLQVQYLLGYNAPERRTGNSYRSIEVSIPDRPELRIRARKGYYAPQTADP